MEDVPPGCAAAGERGPRFGKVLKRKGEYDCAIASSENDKPKDCTTESTRNGDLVDTLEEQFGYLNISGQGVWGELSKQVASKLSERVYAIASFRGDKMICSCSGILIQWKPHLITLLTSGSLVRSFHDESKIVEDLTIRVWNEHYQYADGWLEQYDLHHNIALVNFQAPGCVSPASLQHKEQLQSGSKVVAVGCLFNSRKLMATSGIVLDKVSTSDGEEFMISTCKVNKAGTGGPLIDFNGFLHGMNFYDVEQTIFLPRNIILKCMERFEILRAENKQGGHRASKDERSHYHFLRTPNYCVTTQYRFMNPNCTCKNGFTIYFSVTSYLCSQFLSFHLVGPSLWVFCMILYFYIKLVYHHFYLTVLHHTFFHFRWHNDEKHKQSCEWLSRFFFIPTSIC